MKPSHLFAIYLLISVGYLVFSSMFMIRSLPLIDRPESSNLVPVSSNQEIIQEFQPTKDNIHRIYIRLKNDNVLNSDPFFFALKEDLITIREIQINGKNIGDGEWVPFSFPPIPDSAGKTYAISIYSPSTTTSAIKVSQSPQGGIAFRVNYRPTPMENLYALFNYIKAEAVHESIFLTFYLFIVIILIRVIWHEKK